MPRGEPSVLIGVKFPPEEADWVAKEARRRGVSKSDVVRAAVGKERGVPTSVKPRPPARAWEPNERQERLNKRGRS